MLFNVFDPFSDPFICGMSLIVFWLFWPGMMFLVGFIGESRLVPIWKHQSKMFFPGDFSLGIMVLSLVGMYAKTEIANSYSPLWWACAAAIVAFLGWSIRRGDVKHYPLRSRISPTKLTHDIIGYFVILTMLAGLGVPQVIETIRHRELLDATWSYWLVFGGAVIFYMICAVWDFKNPASKEDILIRHPSDWKPIWKKELKH